MRVSLLILFALAACAPSEPQFAKPAENAPEWHLNEGEWPGTNAMIHPPTVLPGTFVNAGQ